MIRRRPARRTAAPAAATTALGAMVLAACGATASPASSASAWRAVHPDPSADVRFLDASGVCVITVRYPDAAPGVIVVDMTSFVQRDRSPRPAATPAGRVAATSGDWSVIVVSPTEVRLLTGDALFDYRAASC